MNEDNKTIEYIPNGRGGFTKMTIAENEMETRHKKEGGFGFTNTNKEDNNEN